MRSYFFHLAFELYGPEPSGHQDSTLTSPAFLPSSESNIFSDLPEHSIIPWSSSLEDTFQKSSQKKRNSDPLLAWRKPNLPARSQQGSRLAIAKKDWRFDAVSIVSIDMESNSKVPRSVRGKSFGHENRSKAPASGPATRGVFISSDPKNTDAGYGIVHLYRDVKESPGLYEEDVKKDIAENNASSSEAAKFDSNTCSTLCILAVPSYMTPSDLLGYVGENTTREDVSHFRLIRTGRTNKYMVLMKFRDPQKAKEWQKEYNGKPFNSMEPEYCNVVFVKSISFQTPEQSQQPTSFPNMTNDPFLPDAQSNVSEAQSSTLESPIASSLSTKPLAPPTPALVELPTCPVCLERMDESTGLLIILCQHVFHCACLEKWKSSGCPVCRYTQHGGIPGLIRGPNGSEEEHNACSVCGAEQNLWICLICGNMGCGRYDSAHAFAHWEETNHCYAMDIATQHVWDYAGDGYVHRLIQSKGDGKLMDLPAAAWSGQGMMKEGGLSAFGSDTVPREKMEAMGNEYTYLLTSQLDSQRLYYEEQLERAVDKASKAGNSADHAAAAVDSLTKKLEIMEINHKEAMAQIGLLNKEVEKARKRSEKADALARKMGSDWKEEKTVNDSLMERIKFLDGKVKEVEEIQHKLEEEKRDLEEQNRDLTFFISSTEKLKETGEDLDGAKIEVPAAQAESSKKRRGKGRR